ncbi:hypothetical protein KJK34_05020 [Flavobacterium sp. D11R37]|uniref:DUF6095 family protein n=1 Tax=Flavobacterium coralii TaxID=2838017 RepID=UPI001CA7604F|nr:DUF6095 family protein [Flavobacterium coralii]MBY8962110.1 hypothetical protein [Flavobacterium coralii]
MATDRKLLMKGIGYMAWAVPQFFLGPVVIYNACMNKNHPLFIPVFGLGVIFCFLAIMLMALGLKTIMKSLD